LQARRKSLSAPCLHIVKNALVAKRGHELPDVSGRQRSAGPKPPRAGLARAFLLALGHYLNGHRGFTD